MIWWGLIATWLGILIMYMSGFIWPNIHVLSDKVYEKNRIKPGTFLDKLYLDKSAYPKLKCNAIIFIVVFIITVILNCCELVLYFAFGMEKIVGLLVIINIFLIITPFAIERAVLEYLK